MNSDIRPLTASPQAGLAERLDKALAWRTRQAELDIDDVAVAIGLAPAALAAKRAGREPILFQDVEALEDHFTAIGFSGLIDELRRPQGWSSRSLPLNAARSNAIASQLLDVVAEIRTAERSLPELLSEKGLLAHVHIMIRADDAIRTVHCGGAAAAHAVNVDRSILGRDLRSLSDRAYGLFLHNHISELLRRGQPDVSRITSPSLRYSRLSIPAGLTLVSHSFDVEATESFALR